MPVSRSPRRLLAAALALTLLLGGCAALDRQQREWIFRPSSATWAAGLAAAEGMQDVWIAFDSPASGAPARLHGLWLPQADASAPTVLYLHGARWDVRGSAPRMRRLHALGFAVLGIDYRGFGRSEGSELPSEALAGEDARAAWDWLGRQAPGAPRFVYGHSLGGAIAVDLASRSEGVAGLMVEGSFPSLPDLVSTFRWGWLPVGPLITQRFDAASRMAEVRAPVLVVHGSEDRLVPPALGRTLYERAPGPKRFLLVEGGSHHDSSARGMDDYRVAVRDLFGVEAAE